MLATHPALSYNQKALLRKGRILTLSDLVLTSPQEIARRCRVALSEIQLIVSLACKSQPIQSRNLAQIFSENGLEDDNENDEVTRQLRLLGRKFTTGDHILDGALGGGIRTGMIWEIVGESSAGKTQLALQLSLSVQLPPSQGGLAGSACYLTTSRLLETHRLKQISTKHPLFSSPEAQEDISFDNVHTLRIPEISTLENVLESILPKFIEDTTKAQTESKKDTTKPVRLLILDALGELFHFSPKTSTQTLVQRSQNVSRISSLLHSLASRYGLAIVVLNEVVDAFQTPNSDHYGESHNNNEEDNGNIGLLYASHSRWFQRAHSLPGEDRKEASLGLVWANQVNARIMLSRTGRRRYIYNPSGDEGKKRRIDTAYSDTESASSPGTTVPLTNTSSLLEDSSPTLIRRLTVIFSSASPLSSSAQPSPSSLDYIVTKNGIEVLQDSDPSLISRFRRSTGEPSTRPGPASVSAPDSSPKPIGDVDGAEMGAEDSTEQDISLLPPATQLTPLDIGFVVEDNNADIALDGSASISSGIENQDRGQIMEEEDEWDKYWAADDITEEMYFSTSGADGDQGHHGKGTGGERDGDGALG
ncbi:P-loop containing nucleoside triphosphate hydrolase protein, partial [Dendrothele bispora CBS 962.96]